MDSAWDTSSAVHALAALVMAITVAGGIWWLLAVGPSGSSGAGMWHRAALLGALPLAAIATVVLATVPATAAGYLHAATSGGLAEPLLVAPWLNFLAAAGVLAVGDGDRAAVNASFDTVRDVLAVHLVLMVAYAGNVILWQLGTTLRLLRAGRRLSAVQRQTQFRQR